MDIKETVRDVICEQLNVPPEAVGMDKQLYDDLNIDSLDQVELVMALEEELDIEIPDDAATKFKTPRDIVTYLEGVIKD